LGRSLERVGGRAESAPSHKHSFPPPNPKTELPPFLIQVRCINKTSQFRQDNTHPPITVSACQLLLSLQVPSSTGLPVRQQSTLHHSAYATAVPSPHFIVIRIREKKITLISQASPNERRMGLTMKCEMDLQHAIHILYHITLLFHLYHYK
jgi:hypothetical protein